MIFTFDQEQELQYVSAKNSKIGLSAKHYKDGIQSLRWDYKEQAQLKFCVDIGYQDLPKSGKDSRRHAFGVYLYSEDLQNHLLHFGFYKNEIEQCGFDAHVNFTGWRSIFVKFEHDMEGMPCNGMDSLVITVKNGSGTLFIDQLVTSSLFDTRSAVASYQVPFVRSPKKPKFTHYTLMQLIPKNKSAENEEMNAICKRYAQNIIHNYNKFRKSEEEITEFFNNLSIVESQDGILGKPIEYQWQREIYQAQKYPIEHQPIELREYVTVMYAIAYQYITNQQETFKEMYITMLKHLIDQGLQEGSGMGVLHHIDYSLRMFYPSAFLMRDVIKEAGLFETVRKLIAWFSEFGMVFINEYIPDLVTADTMNNLSQAFLISALLSGDVSYLEAYKRWLDIQLKPTVGLTGMIKEDGSIYHHCGHYTIYGMDGLTGLMPAIYVLSGTPYQISDESWAWISKVLLNMRFYVNQYDMPLTMSGRHPHGKWRINLVPFRYWALAGLARGDEQPIAVYKRLLNEKEATEEDKPILESFVEPEKDPQGQLTMNMACASFHRWQDVLVSVKGFSKYMWGNETYVANNLYGRYMGYSHLEIIRHGQQESGFSQEGFDWAALPGTTAIHLPIDNMLAKVYNLDDQSGFEEMLLSDEPFAGGVDDGKNGMFAMKLQGHPKYDGSHSATISKFFVDGFILCLGSDIKNDETRFATYTTLFQKTGEYEKTENTITDCMGNVYYPVGGQNVQVKRGVQISQDQAGKGENSGMYSVAYIDHGTAPQNAEYEYGIGLLGLKKPVYEVLQKDNIAHIVRFGNTTYYAVFEPQKFDGCAKLQKTDQMLLLMVEEKGNELICSVCQPDLGLYDYDASQYDNNGNRIEVSIYSRDWIQNPVKEHHVKLTINDKNIEFTAKGGQVVQFNI